MRDAFNMLPQGATSLLANARASLLDIADDVPEEIIGILCATPHINGNSALVITATRIIEMTTGGAMQVFPYSELSAIRVVGGKKKFFGGYDTIYFLVDTVGGTNTYPLFSDHDWSADMATAAESAFKKFRIRAT
jgi:hypothetical protein